MHNDSRFLAFFPIVFGDNAGFFDFFFWGKSLFLMKGKVWICRDWENRFRFSFGELLWFARVFLYVFVLCLGLFHFLSSNEKSCSPCLSPSPWTLYYIGYHRIWEGGASGVVIAQGAFGFLGGIIRLYFYVSKCGVSCEIFMRFPRMRRSCVSVMR